MPTISGPSITSIGCAAARRASSVSASIQSVIPSTSACDRRSPTGASRQRRSGAADTEWPATPAADCEEPFGGVGAPVEDEVLHPLPQVRRQVVVERQLAGVDDAHVDAGPDGVEQEHGVDGLADRVVPAEGERHVADPAAHRGVRQLRLDPPGGLDVREPVVGVLLDPGADGEDVRVEDDVLGREPCLVDEQPVRRWWRSRPCAPPCRPGPARRTPSRRRRRRSGAPAAPAGGTIPRPP